MTTTETTYWVWIDSAELAEVRLVDTGRALIPQRIDSGRFVAARRCRLADEDLGIAIVPRDQLIVEEMARLSVRSGQHYLAALAGC